MGISSGILSPNHEVNHEQDLSFFTPLFNLIFSQINNTNTLLKKIQIEVKSEPPDSEVRPHPVSLPILEVAMEGLLRA